MRRRANGLALSLLVATGAPALGQLQQTMFRADDGTAFQVLRAANLANGAEKIRLTSVAGSVVGTASCVGSGHAAGAAVSAVGRSIFAATLHPFALVRRSFVLTPNDIAALSFDPDAGGRVVLGTGSGALAVCSSPFDCAGVPNLQPLVALDSSLGNLPPACTAHTLAAPCDLGNSGDAFAFGLPAHGALFECDNPAQVTTSSTLCAQPPADGIDLGAGAALVFVYGSGLQTSAFAIAAGGFGVTVDADNPFGCPANSIVDAIADSEHEPPPSPTPTGTPTAAPTRPAIPVVASPLSPAGLALIAGVALGLIVVARRRAAARLEGHASARP